MEETTVKKTRAPRGSGITRQKKQPETTEQKVTRINEEIKALERQGRAITLEIKKRNLDLEFLQEEGKD